MESKAYEALKPQEAICTACRGTSKLAFERTPYRVQPGVWAHKPSPGYVHKAAVCPASPIWETA